MTFHKLFFCTIKTVSVCRERLHFWPFLSANNWIHLYRNLYKFYLTKKTTAWRLGTKKKVMAQNNCMRTSLIYYHNNTFNLNRKHCKLKLFLCNFKWICFVFIWLTNPFGMCRVAFLKKCCRLTSQKKNISFVVHEQYDIRRSFTALAGWIIAFMFVAIPYTASPTLHTLMFHAKILF